MATTVGLMHLELCVTQAQSLKDKRRVIRSFKDRAARANNVSVAEVDATDSRQRAVLAVVVVGSDKRRLASSLQGILNAASKNRDMVLMNHEIEWL